MCSTGLEKTESVKFSEVAVGVLPHGVLEKQNVKFRKKEKDLCRTRLRERERAKFSAVPRWRCGARKVEERENVKFSQVAAETYV